MIGRDWYYSLFHCFSRAPINLQRWQTASRVRRPRPGMNLVMEYVPAGPKNGSRLVASMLYLFQSAMTEHPQAKGIWRPLPSMGASSLTQELRMSMYQSKNMKVDIGLTRK